MFTPFSSSETWARLCAHCSPWSALPLQTWAGRRIQVLLGPLSAAGPHWLVRRPRPASKGNPMRRWTCSAQGSYSLPLHRCRASPQTHDNAHNTRFPDPAGVATRPKVWGSNTLGASMKGNEAASCPTQNRRLQHRKCATQNLVALHIRLGSR